MRSIENHKCRYMLTEEGKEVARECLLRSELLDPNKNLDSLNDVPDLDQRDKSIVDSTKVVLSDMGLDNDALVKKVALPSADSKKQKKSIDVPSEYLDKVSYWNSFMLQVDVPLIW